MTAHRLLLASLTLLLLPACGAKVAVDGSAAGSGGAGGAGGSLATNATVGTTTVGTTTVGTTTVGTTSTGGAGCNGSVDLAFDGQPLHLLSSVCGNTWNPTMATGATGFIFAGGPAPGVEGLNLDGCASLDDGSEGLQLSLPSVTGPGKVVAGSAQYNQKLGETLFSVDNSLVVDITKLGAVGDTIEGSFSMVLSANPMTMAEHKLTGTFSVCHVPDEDVP